MPRIRILPDTLVSQIAAGEVVERPASVVKELLENALDAGATTVEIELEGGGARRVRVADDGSGMDRDDVLLAFDRHATSKIASFADLERVATLGFRGEALASIAAVAKVELVSAETPGDGARVRVEGGRVLVAEPAARARGTTVDVAALFWNVPARRKFLKTHATELRRCLEVVEGYALAHPQLALRVRHEGRALLDAPRLGGDESGLRARIAQIFGPGLERELATVSAELAGGAVVRGLVGSPATARGRRSFVFVNRRLVRDRALLAAFYRAVREEWRSEEFPSLFLFLELAPDRLDVNVHPQKAEVRFRDAGLADRVGEALRAALARARREEPAPLRAPSGALPVAPAWEGLGGRFGVTPVGPTPIGPTAGEVHETPGPELEDPSVRDQDRDKTRSVRLGVGPASAEAKGSEKLDGAEVDGSGAASAGEAFPFHGGLPSGGAQGWPAAGRAGAGAGGRAGEAGRIAVAAFAPLERSPVPLSGRSGEVRPFRLLGQYKGALILLEGPDGLYLIDQHVAHERILYERLRRELEVERSVGQRLVTPLLLELSRAEALHLASLASALAPLGFEIEELSGGSLAVSATPAALAPDPARGLLLALATDPEAAPGNLRRRLLDDFAASMACRAAVKMHHPLAAEKIEALVSELFRAENPYACPHGRPVVLVLADADLERRFQRR